ncbi:hypothetical protein CAS74_001763 [Pichia kudriavzevii]|uniref:3-phytase A n=1 Tax=Pichia kudriavzevii TaxID=4909 RepID=A0A1Z8JS74_PICKU|nr:hypothetical protein CAS74_001763 [Pichia kudriavzevii]
MLSLPVLATLISAISALPIGSDSRIPSPTSSEDLFPTDIGFFGVTATNSAPFMAQTDGAAITYGVPTSSYTLAQPIETAIQAKDHREGDQNIFQLMGNLSPYYISDGWGVYDYAIPGQCSISQVHLLSRHGSRYPTDPLVIGKLLDNKNYTVTGELEFLNDWKYLQGVNILTKLGNQQLFDKGDWNEDAEKIVARTTSQERITSSAEYFLAGFYGLDWYDKANLEIIIESNGYNDTLAPYEHCPLTDKTEATASIPADGFLEKYTKKAVERLNKQIKGLTFNAKSIHQMQELCAYETNNNGFSHFCGLFTQQEWEDYEYYNSWTWYNSNMFGSPNGRAMGAGWVEEFKQRLTDSNDFDWNTLALQNTTLDTNPTYFPVDQKLYFDFSHDSVISNIFTALGMEQFKTNFTVDGSLRETNFQLSKVVPFASQTYFEIIECDGEVSANRTEPETSSNSTTGTPNKYVHMILNDHTIDLSKNFPEYCSPRVDGWCEFDSFVKYLDTLWEVADFEEACFSGTYNTTQIVTDGAPEK